ncbi:MAG: hypothetical protein A2840_02085 [Candidatus Buchananbacteria bacterium RIFCSPHIGHO2_01_FULL_47_11b]|uniref:Histidine kinase N-terminal 7TM region domain-containing protein n=1 Tax=Candidatus Buchananbacteria bacterium RIFCSPHIGHO2_01_FULL_47_11b TaxID=1797537 RepID=A0A1G1Y999_9BACT|nr:MAG: hypothetical protein A2840_02085 [Candidatus Buchananbacteria bacterium RIFCSPHIGHO2_01_FULL_47_11b]
MSPSIYIYIVSTFLLAFSSLAVGFFSLGRNFNSKVVRLWFLMNMAVAVWATGHALSIVVGQSGDLPLTVFYLRLLRLGVAFIPIFYLHFILSFFHQEKRYRWLLLIGYVVAVIFIPVNLFTSYFTASATPKVGFNLWLEGGQYNWVSVIYFWLYALFSLYFLYRGYKESDGIIKKKAGYILVASIIGFGGGGTVWLPETVGIYPFGQFITWLYPLIITYGIFAPLQIKIKQE